MPEEPFPPPVPPARQPPEVRPPVPGWLFALFGLGPILVCVLFCVVSVHGQPEQMGQATMIGFIGGVVFGVPMLCGLALAARFSSGTGARIVGGLFFGVLCVVGFGGVLFAGCMCLTGGKPL